MPSPEFLIKAGGAYTIGFVVFHLLFWKLFRWRTELAKLTSLNRAIVQVLNLSLTFAFVVFAFISLAHTAEMLVTPIGRALTVLIAAFWFFRAGEQIVFFGLKKKLSMAFLVLFIVGGSLYAVALVTS